MIHCGFGSNFGKVSVAFPPVSDPYNILQSFSTTTKICTKSCLFNVMNSGSGSAKAKSYGSWRFRFHTTLPSRALPVGVLAMFVVQLNVELGDTHSAEDHLSVAAT
jgi:hypothetical protein